MLVCGPASSSDLGLLELLINTDSAPQRSLRLSDAARQRSTESRLFREISGTRFSRTRAWAGPRGLSGGPRSLRASESLIVSTFAHNIAFKLDFVEQHSRKSICS